MQWGQGWKSIIGYLYTGFTSHQCSCWYGLISSRGSLCHRQRTLCPESLSGFFQIPTSLLGNRVTSLLENRAWFSVLFVPATMFVTSNLLCALWAPVIPSERPQDLVLVDFLPTCLHSYLDCSVCPPHSASSAAPPFTLVANYFFPFEAAQHFLLKCDHHQQLFSTHSPWSLGAGNVCHWILKSSRILLYSKASITISQCDAWNKHG